MFAKLKRALLMLWAVLSALAVIAGVILLRKKRQAVQQGIEENAENERERAKNEIENTPADELVAASDNADALCRERESIAERFRHEVQLRVNEKLHGKGSAGSP